MRYLILTILGAFLVLTISGCYGDVPYQPSVFQVAKKASETNNPAK